MTKQTSSGKCSLCGSEFGKAAMARHLAKCMDSTDRGKCKPAFHVLVEGRNKAYWLHLALSTAAHLSKLDEFLRGIWLECCGHMSEFQIQGQRYSTSPMDDDLGFGDNLEKSANVAAGKVLTAGSRFSYEYDYGSTTDLSLKVLDLREVPVQSAVQLLARNNAPPIACNECATGNLATQICVNCSLEEDSGWYCDECAETHACGEEMLLPVVNSPRAGVCGYTG